MMSYQLRRRLPSQKVAEALWCLAVRRAGSAAAPMPQFLDHITDDVLPALLDKLSAE
jgi:hypothetical protein